MRLIDDLHRYFATDTFPGVVRLTTGPEVVFEAACGMASRAWGVPNTLATRFDTASITKLFTVAATLQQIDAGAFTLDTPVVEYLGLTDTMISRRATVRHLLTHSSGIGDDADEESGESYEDLFRDRPSYRVLETIDLVEGFRHKPAYFAPGEGCRYNNAAFVLLGLCVERASGSSYREYVQQHVFAPAGMTRSGFFRMDRVEPEVAEGANPVVDAAGAVTGWRRNIYSYPPVGSPDGGAHVTAADLERFLTAARTGRLFSADLTEAFLVPHVFHSQTESHISRYGLGLEFVSDLDSQLLYFQKDGYNVGVSGIVRYYPQTDLTVVVLSNTSEGAWQPIRAINEMLAVASDL
jgi:CubicO group peptidase (beta-lactamase class C family)